MIVGFFVPAWECCEEEEANKCKDDGDNTVQEEGLVTAKSRTTKDLG